MKLYNKYCFDVFKTLKDHSVDMVCVDPPYGTTSIKWDETLDFKKTWAELDRIVKPKANIIIFGSQPFSTMVIHSNIKRFKYELVWNKNKCGSPGTAKHRPLKVHENIMIFSSTKGLGVYDPIIESGEPYERNCKSEDGYGSGKNSHGYGFANKDKNKYMSSKNNGTRYPKSILHASRNFSAQQTVHPTQKPTNLLNWLLMTYSKEGDTVMDFTMGSGSCGVSAKMTGRSFIGIESDTLEDAKARGEEESYFHIAQKRIDETVEYSVGRNNHQLTTQISKDMITL